LRRRELPTRCLLDLRTERTDVSASRFRLDGERTERDVGKRHRPRRIARRHRIGNFATNQPGHDRIGRSIPKKRLAHDGFPQEHASTEDVHALIVLVTEKAFRRGVSDHLGRQAAGAHCPMRWDQGDEPRLAIDAHHDVRRNDLAMHEVERATVLLGAMQRG
jgi:hypothetical protein